jgi:hypothetical protein
MIKIKLMQAIKESNTSRGFDTSKFFKIWFNDEGNSFYLRKI